MINLIAQVCMYNEVVKGNLARCLDNLRRYCDHILVYDDCSTDDSVKVAEDFGCIVIRGKQNNQIQELAHKQFLLEKAIELGATHLFWLDCDEVLDRLGTLGGLRDLCKNWPKGLDAYSFPEINLWRSQIWQRLDSLFTTARFVRLWKAKKKIRFDVREGVHKKLYPTTIKKIKEAPFSVIHYGFWDYKKMLVKIGANHLDKQGIQDCAEFGLDRKGANWILDERKCLCRKLPDEIFPPGCLPPDIWLEPKPKTIEQLIPYSELSDEPLSPMVDIRARHSWKKLHDNGYHKEIQSQTINERNRKTLEWKHPDPMVRATWFRFDPTGKVVYDVGCGGGWHMLDCIQAGAKKVIGFEVDNSVINAARNSFQELGVDQTKYDFVHIGKTIPDLPKADIIYSLAVLMHIPFWQAIRYFYWMKENLSPNGELYLQFYQRPGQGETMFYGGLKESDCPGCDSVSNKRLHYELSKVGFLVVDSFLLEGDGIVPVWQMYKLVGKL